MLHDIFDETCKRETRIGNNCSVHTNKRVIAHGHKPWFNDECIKLYNRYKYALRQFNYNRSNLNRLKLSEAKNKYKLLEKTLRSPYMIQEGNIIGALRKNNPKAFYNKFSKLKKGQKCDLTIEDVINHFKDLAGSTRDNTQETDDSTNQDNQTLYEELDSPITKHEILYVLSNAKRNKSPGMDGLLYEFFVECKYIMIPILCILFNVILDSGNFPENWCNGTIIPVFKKGDKNDVNNYRGITLMSHLSKLFTTILNNRLLNVSSTYNIISDAQFGFKARFRHSGCYFCSPKSYNYYTWQ